MSDRRIVTLTRDLKNSGPLGTPGHIDTGSFQCASLERPPAGYVKDHPSIPAGEYDVDWTDVHPHHNPCYEIMHVPGRTAILIHSANWFQQLLGCVAPGAKWEEVVDLGGEHLGAPGAKQLGVSASGPALKALLDDLHRQNFRLIIKEVV